MTRVRAVAVRQVHNLEVADPIQAPPPFFRTQAGLSGKIVPTAVRERIAVGGWSLKGEIDIE